MTRYDPTQYAVLKRLTGKTTFTQLRPYSGKKLNSEARDLFDEYEKQGLLKKTNVNFGLSYEITDHGRKTLEEFIKIHKEFSEISQLQNVKHTKSKNGKPLREKIHPYQKDPTYVHSIVQRELTKMKINGHVTRDMFVSSLNSLEIEDPEFTASIFYNKFDENKREFGGDINYLIDVQLEAEERSVQHLLITEELLKVQRHEINHKEVGTGRYYSIFPNTKKIESIKPRNLVDVEVDPLSEIPDDVWTRHAQKR